MILEQIRNSLRLAHKQPAWLQPEASMIGMCQHISKEIRWASLLRLELLQVHQSCSDKGLTLIIPFFFSAIQLQLIFLSCGSRQVLLKITPDLTTVTSDLVLRPQKSIDNYLLGAWFRLHPHQTMLTIMTINMPILWTGTGNPEDKYFTFLCSALHTGSGQGGDCKYM